MALLLSAMRTGAFTGSSKPVEAWLAGRQFGWWAGQFARPPAAPRRDPEQTRQALDELRASGVIDDAEHARLSERLGA